MQVVGVKFKSVNEICWLDANKHEIKKGDAVICESDGGLLYGVAETSVEEKDTNGEYKKVVRVASEGDKRKLIEIHKKEIEAVSTAKKLIKKHELDMKLIDAEYSFDMTKLCFSFTAEGRVDFRDLLKSLASEFKTRIELKKF